MELQRSEQEALLAPQSGADLLTHSSQLAALRPDGVLGIVGVFDEPVAFTGQGQGPVRQVLSKHTCLTFRPEYCTTDELPPPTG